MLSSFNQEAFSRDIADTSGSKKSVLVGTHRVCPPEETFARVQPFLAPMGITRVADVTQLDDIGIPVFQAIRPNSRNISLSQGKGVSRELAKVSAVMESIECWHAEQPELTSFHATIAEMAPQLPYAIDDLNMDTRHMLHDDFMLEWFPAATLGDAEHASVKSYLPARLVRLDFTMKTEWYPSTFFVSSNGLASGNTFEEACLHGLYEVIERDTFEQVRRGRIQKIQVDVSTIDGIAAAFLMEKFERAEATVKIFYAVSSLGVPCFEVYLSSSSCPLVAGGYGCHLDRDIALSRALTEAAQSRLTCIAGARDDLGRSPYEALQSRLPLSVLKKRHDQQQISFSEIPSFTSLDLVFDINEVNRRITSVLHKAPLVINLTRQEFNIPVVFIVMPKLRFLETLR